MAPKQAQPCAKYQYVVTSSGPKIVPVPDQESKDEESAADYNSGGYLAVKLKDTFKNDRYVVLRKLGWGHFSTVWLVKDNELHRHSALKVVKSAGRYAETARDEIRLLRKVMAANPSHPGRNFVVSFLDSFQHCGPEDIHICIVFEPLGENLLSLIERNKKKGVPRGLVKVITRQILLGLQYLHEQCDLVHTDIKPENIMIAIPEVESHILAQLSTSPSPTSRKVGVPQKSRAGVTIPKRARERHVQIFDSQPIPSPTPSSSSNPSSPVARHGLRMSHIRSPPGTTSGATSIPHSVSTSTSTSVTSSIVSTSMKSTSTPPTSFGSVAPKVALPIFDNESDIQAKTSILIPPPAGPPPRPTIGPSLLTQTAPRNLEAIDSADPPPRSRSPTPPLSSPLPPPINIKIADLGNATPSKSHFTEDIQTRQYRSPEAILGKTDWGYTADVWSVACVVFELLTAEYLFDPQSQGELFSKDDDHMAQIIELLGDFATEIKVGGKYSREIFDANGGLRYIKSLKPWPLKRVMKEKYLFTELDATALTAFLKPMLTIDHRKRASAGEMAKHDWLNAFDETDDVEWL